MSHQKTGGWPMFWYVGRTPPIWAKALMIVYCAVLWLKRIAYQLGLLKTVKLPVPVVVVGNRVVGGAGKTPLLLALVPVLQAQGWRVGIISRGYGRKDHLVRAVDVLSTSDLVGDEPLLLWQTLGVPVYVGSDRVAAARELLANTPVDIILSDDGWQHWRLSRDYVIEVVDVDKGYGNGYCLPAGPLREPENSLPSADLTLYNGRDFTLVPCYWRNVKTGKQCALDKLSASVVAMAGIGNPQRFFDTVSQLNIEIVHAVALKDHQALSLSVVQQFDDGQQPLVMTLKDAVRCREFAQEHWWALVVETQVDVKLFSSLISQLNQQLSENN